MVHTLDPVITSSILIGAFSLYMVHWFRRSLRETGDSFAGSEVQATGFDRVQRLFHWSVTVGLVVISATGLVLYYPTYVEPFVTSLGLPLHSFFSGWIEIHFVAAVAILCLLAIHIGWDSVKIRTTGLMLPARNDVQEALQRTWRFLWGGKPTQRSGKYDVFMKSYHILLTVCFVFLGITGAVQYVWAPWWLYPELLHGQIEPWWKPTLLHDFFGFLLIALVVGHTYFSLLPSNRTLFVPMIRGSGRAKTASSNLGKSQRELDKEQGSQGATSCT